MYIRYEWKSEELSNLVEEWFPTITFNGYYIAGGFLRSFMMGQTPKDMDIFFTDLSYLEEVEEALTKLGYEGKATVFAKTYKKGSKTIQLIITHSGSVEEIFEDFDFTVCQFALQDNLFCYTEEAMTDLLAKRLVVTGAALSRWATTMERMFKYASYGFKPNRASLTSIVRMVKEAPVEDLFIHEKIKREVIAGKGQPRTGGYDLEEV